MPRNPEECCPEFKPEQWDEKEITWRDKPFVKDHIRSFLHMPLNFGAVMDRNMKKIDAAGANTEQRIVITDEKSLWGSDVYIEVSKEVPGAEMAKLSGTFLSKAFEGPYSKMRSFVTQMKAFVQGKGKSLGKMYFYYPLCPKCAKKYGKNYVGILAQV